MMTYNKAETNVVPAADVSEDTRSASKERKSLSPADIKHNMMVIILLDAIFYMGFSDLQLAMQPLLVYLKASNAMIGLVTGASMAGLIGVFISPWITRRFRIKKWYMFIVHVPYIGALACIGLSVVFSRQLGLTDSSLLYVVFALTLMHFFFGGFVSLPHQEYVAACIPMSHRGRYTGWSFSAGGILSIISASIGGWILYHINKPLAFGYVLLMGWAIAQGGYLLALLGREVPTPVEESPRPWSISMLKEAWQDKPFLRFLSLYILSNTIIWPVFAFVNIHGFKDLGMIPATSAVIQIISQAVRIGSCIVIGIFTDKIGAKKVYPYWFLVAFLSMLAAILIQGPLGVYVSVGLSSLYIAGTSAAIYALLYGLPSPKNRAGHFSIQLILSYLSASVGPIMMGRLCDALPYRTVFMIIAAVAIGFFVFGKYILSTLSDKSEAYS